MAFKRRGLAGPIVVVVIMVWVIHAITRGPDTSSSLINGTNVVRLDQRQTTGPPSTGVNSTVKQDRAIPAPQILWVSATTLNVRDGPSTTTSVQTQVSRGASVKVFQREGGWALVETANGRRGWVSAQYLSSIEVSAVAPTPTPTQPIVSAIVPNRSDIVRKIIQNSIRRYSGSCPCPYNSDSAGRSCGRRSAYSRPGGASPICYENQVTNRMIEQFLAQN